MLTTRMLLTNQGKTGAIGRTGSSRDLLEHYTLLVAYACCFALWIYINKKFYHGNISSEPARLTATIDFWRTAPISRHWFLYFYSPADAANGIPYANIPYLCGIFYATYHLLLNSLTLGRWPFATTYFMTMIALFAGSWFVLRPIIDRARFWQALLVLPLCAGILVTSPHLTTFLWANHDTFLAFAAIAATVLAYAIWRQPVSLGPLVWVALGYSTMSHLLGIVTLACCFIARRRLPLKTRTWLILFGFAVFNMVFPFIVAKLVFGQTSASTFLFRSGLDGSTQYFSTHWQAIFEPVAHRSFERELSMKLFVCLVLVAIGWRFARDAYPSLATATAVSLIPYASHWAVFPQAVSIHPYLYDLLFLVPFDIGLAALAAIVLVRFREPTHDLLAAIAAGAAILLIHDNLLLLAQKKLLG